MFVLPHPLAEISSSQSGPSQSGLHAEQAWPNAGTPETSP